jgi:hypothetical protein
MSLRSESFNWLEMSRAVSALEAAIVGAEVAEIRLHDEVIEFEAAVDASNKGRTGEHFRKSLNTLPPSRFLGVSGWASDGRVLFTTANRYDDIGGWDLQRYIREFWGRCYVGVDGAPARLHDDAAAFARGRQGPFVYIGETFVDPALSGGNVAAHLVRMCILISCMKWSPAYIYGWMVPKHAFKGLGLRWGFTEFYSSALRWQVPPATAAYEDLCFLGCTPAGVRQILRSPLIELQRS